MEIKHAYNDKPIIIKARIGENIEQLPHINVPIALPLIQAIGLDIRPTLEPFMKGTFPVQEPS